MKNLLILFLSLTVSWKANAQSILIAKSPMEITYIGKNAAGDSLLSLTLKQSHIAAYSNYTVSDTCHLRTIDVYCNNCIVYFPVGVMPGLKCWINNRSTGTISLKTAPVNGAKFQAGYTKTISVNGRPLLADYETTSLLNIR